MSDLVLVTGASGYIAMHCVLQLLEQGYRVRGTVRSMSRAEELHNIFKKKLDTEGRLEFVEANLLSDDGWDEAVNGCRYMLHVASPVPRKLPESEDEVIKPALEGTKRVLQAAAKAGVQRVVLTSSVAAIRAGNEEEGRIFTEKDWSKITEKSGPYEKSKTLAEQAAWEFISQQDSMELVAINPSVAIGPPLRPVLNTSIMPVRTLLAGDYPGYPRIGWAFVDVRDVAAAHIAAMITPEAAGMRFCCVREFAWMGDMARILSAEFAGQGYKIPKFQLPDFLLRIIAMFDRTARLVLPQLGQKTTYSTEQIRNVLKWEPRPLEDSVLETARALIEFDLV